MPKKPTRLISENFKLHINYLSFFMLVKNILLTKQLERQRSNNHVNKNVFKYYKSSNTNGKDGEFKVRLVE